MGDWGCLSTTIHGVPPYNAAVLERASFELLYEPACQKGYTSPLMPRNLGTVGGRLRLSVCNNTQEVPPYGSATVLETPNLGAGPRGCVPIPSSHRSLYHAVVGLKNLQRPWFHQKCVAADVDESVNGQRSLPNQQWCCPHQGHPVSTQRAISLQAVHVAIIASKALLGYISHCKQGTTRLHFALQAGHY